MSDNLTKKDIIQNIHDKTAIPQKSIKAMLEIMLDTVGDALVKGRNVELRNFGVFEVQIRKSRIGRNPKRPEDRVIIPERSVIKFKSGKELKSRLSGANKEAGK